MSEVNITRFFNVPGMQVLFSDYLEDHLKDHIKDIFKIKMNSGRGRRNQCLSVTQKEEDMIRYLQRLFIKLQRMCNGAFKDFWPQELRIFERLNIVKRRPGKPRTYRRK